ncbi:hypothetical protein QFZ67_001609 [Streptomyces sp. V1I1]|nr:hypothetical protein [Streptomyces sp. V1I1]
MVSTDRFLAFAAMSLLVIVIPGPSVLFVIGRALAHGRRTAVATALGNVFGSYILVVAVALGVDAHLVRPLRAPAVDGGRRGRVRDDRPGRDGGGDGPRGLTPASR